MIAETSTRGIHIGLRRVGCAMSAAAASTLLLTAAPSAETLPIIAVVNGDSLTTAYLDHALMEMHRGSNMAGREDLDLTDIVGKVINDRLILQQARWMGLDEEPTIIQPVTERNIQRAVRLYVRDSFDPPDSVAESRVREYFDEYYWKIQISQISLQTQAEAAQVVAALNAGAPWDSLASQVSLDSHRYRGGRHNLKYWGDVENEIRDAVRELPVGRLSAPFPYKGLVSVALVEERHPVDEEAYPRFSPAIHDELRRELQRSAWAAFVDEHVARTPVSRNEEVLESIRADSSKVLRGEFRVGTNALALRLDDRHTVDETSLRYAISRSAMEDGRAPFLTHLERAVEKKVQQLVLGAAAEAAGYLDSPELVRDHERDLRVALIEAYLQETVAPNVVFSRKEFEDYYNEHREEFLESDQVQIATLVVEDEEVAREIASRLQAGADFAFIKEQYLGPRSSLTQERPKWSSITLFSDEIRNQIEEMEVGGTSDAIHIGHSWLVFKLNGHREGRLRGQDEVEHEIRKVMYDRKLQEAIDEHLALLKERSEIVVFDEAIQAYEADDS